MAKHTRDSWGSLQYDPKKRTARIRYWAEGPDGYRRRSKTIRNCTRKEAEAARAQLMLEHGEDAPCPTVAQAWERWVLPTIKSRIRSGDFSQNTLNSYNSAYNTHVEPRWGGVPCDEVKALAVQQWISDGKTHSQAKSACKVLSIIMEYAMRYEAVSANVMRTRFIMPSKSTTASQDKGIWDLRQLGELWKLVYGRPYEAAFLLSAFGSCRVGESLAVTVSDVQRRSVDGITLAVVTIDKQVSKRGSSVVYSTKTAESTRHVVLVGRAATRLFEIAESSDSKWLTNNRVGKCMPQMSLYNYWKRDIPDDVRHPFRNLRTSWQTWMRWEMRLPPWIVEPLMGHKGSDITSQHYDRPKVEMFCETVASAYRENVYDAKWTWLDSPTKDN